MKVMTTMYTLRKGGSYDRFKMMLEAFLERSSEIYCLSLTPIQIKHSLFHNHVMYFPFRTTDGLLARFLVLSVFPLWCIWIAWKNRIDLLLAFGSLYAFIQAFSKWFLKILWNPWKRILQEFSPRQTWSPLVFPQSSRFYSVHRRGRLSSFCIFQ